MYEDWEPLREALDDIERRNGIFTNAVENSMRRKERVNIAKVSTAVGKILGKRYVKLAADVMWTAARRTKIHIEDEQ
jgi:hypothetical protein